MNAFDGIAGDGNSQEPPLGGSDLVTLRYLADGAPPGSPLDWLALYRLERLGFVEQTTIGPKITAEGKMAILASSLNDPRGDDD